MKQELKARLARLGRTEATSPARSGSPVSFAIRPVRKTLNSISSIQLLAQHGLTLARAKKAIEVAMASGIAYVRLPAEQDMAALIEAMAQAGFQMNPLAIDAVDVKAVRERLCLSQAEFAARYNLDVDTVQNWEQGRNTPDRASANYLRVIASAPDAVARALENT